MTPKVPGNEGAAKGGPTLGRETRVNTHPETCSGRCGKGLPFMSVWNTVVVEFP